MNLTQSISSDSNFPHYPKKAKWPWCQTTYIKHKYPRSINLPKISIITPSYNQGGYIEECIRSVLLQDYPNLEYIIMDGGSTDGTREIIERYEPWIAHWESVPDRGQSHAINKGLQKATGDWIAWLNTDDAYLENALTTIASTIIQSSEPISWIVGTTIFTDPDLHEITQFSPYLYTAPGRDVNYKPMGWIDFVCTKRSGIALPQPSSFWRRDAVIQAGSINETLRYAMDHELYGRLAYHGFRPTLIQQALTCFRMHHEQKTANFPVVFWEEELDIVHKWIDQVNGTEKEKLKKYGIWLNRHIKTHPFRASFYNLWSRLKRVLKFNWTKKSSKTEKS